MTKFRDNFIKQSKAVMADVELHVARKNATDVFRKSVAESKIQFTDLEAAQQRAASVRWKAIENLEKNLIAFDANFVKAGGRVLWARNTEDAHNEIKQLIHQHGINFRIASHNLADELSLESFLDTHRYKLLSKDDSQKTDIGIVEALFMVAEPAAIVLAENSNRSSEVISDARALLVVVYIDKFLNNLADLNLFLPLSSAFSSAGKNYSDINILFGPRSENEQYGPENIYVMFIDNGRSNLLADTVMRQANRCIGCNACTKVCPVYNSTGGDETMADVVFNGIIKAIEKPYLMDFDSYSFLSQSSTLCGACTAVCPVKIDLHKLIIHTRKKGVTENKTHQREQLFFYLWKQAMLKRDRFGFAKRMQKKLLVENLYEKVWGVKTDMPPLADKSFNELWKEKMK